jgi:arginase family enzyme
VAQDKTGQDGHPTSVLTPTRAHPGSPVDATVVPRFAGDGTFARVERLEHLPTADTIIWGIPFDSGVSYRPGARFGPQHVRQSSRLLQHRLHGPVAVLHFDAHLDTWDTYFGAPYTHGTPFRRASGGLTSRELLEMLRGLDGLNVVGVDVVEVAPSYDHAELTGIAAAHAIFELLSVLPVPSA